MSTTTVPAEEIMQTIREHRSSENNFETLYQELNKTIELSKRADNTTLAESLVEIKEKQVAEYQKAKETGSTAWPEFEKFVTQFERALTTAMKND